MPEVYKAAIIGLVQALTEFLPVSSSGHMVIAKTFLGMEEVGITLEVVTHLATALAVIAYFRKRIVSILGAVLKAITSGPRNLPEGQAADFKFFLLIILASVPAGLVGFLIRDQVGRLFENVTATAVMLIMTGVFVLISGRLARSVESIGVGRSIIIGIAQAVAIIPGVSRSGLTVGSGLLSGARKEEAFEFSLLLSLPAILGATAIEALSGRMGGSLPILLAAAIPAFVCGYFAISLLFRAIARNKFHFFGFYLIPLGILVLLLSR
jgi:undecaprenyl-diphosphatase